MWAIVALLVVYVLIPVAMYLISPKELGREELDKQKEAVVMVLGDLGRSPRMNYHALSIAKCGYKVHLCGYRETDLMREVAEHPMIEVHEIATTARKPGETYLVFAVRKVVHQHVTLFQLLKRFRGVVFLVVQTPPAIPMLGMARFFKMFMSPSTKLVIDWHNLGYSILALRLGKTHMFVKLYRQYEKWIGRRAFIHLTVTVGLGQFLRSSFGMSGRRIMPLYDRPAVQFRLLSEADKKAVRTKHSAEIFDNMQPGERIIVTSTSYTPDENLDTLFDALQQYSQQLEKQTHVSSSQRDNQSGSRLPPIRVIITGKGPLRPKVQKQIAELEESESMPGVSFRMPWLPYEDYPSVLGVADIGVSLHESSSGYDLPMKALDMFGCGVPVVSVNYPCISELIKDNVNGMVVDDAEQMSRALVSILTKPAVQNNLRRGAVRESREKWDTNWTLKLGPLFGVGKYREMGPDEHDSSSDED